MAINTIKADNAPQAIGPYSHAVACDKFVYLSGQIPLKPNGDLVTDNLQEEVKQILSNLHAVLEASGCTISNVIKTTIYLTNMNDFATVNAVYGEFFGEHKPARSTVQVSGLPKGVRVEIDAVAYKI